MLTNRKFAKEIRIFHLIDLLIKRADKIRKQLWKKEYHLLWKYSIWTIFIHLLRNIALCFCLFLTCIGVLNNTLTIGDIMLVITAINILTGNIGELVDILANIKKDTLYFTDFESYLNLTEEKKDSQTSVCEKEIIFQNVSFSYPHTKQYALKDINLEIKPNIIISHRLGITQICDFIYVFEKGKIIEQGNHEQLIKQKGKYFEMYYAQKSLYSE